MSIPLITVPEMLDKVDADLRPRITSMLKRDCGFVCYENIQLDSSAFGQRTFLVFGGPYSNPTLEALLTKHPWLNDLPSQRQYPIAYCLRGT